MENEIIETVLTEILEELRELKKVTRDHAIAIAENGNRLTGIDQKLQAKQVARTEINTQSIERLIFSGMERINATIEQKPAAVRREFRILLFPEYNTREYYRIVFGRIISWLVLLVIARYLYLLGSTWLSTH